MFAMFNFFVVYYYLFVMINFLFVLIKYFFSIARINYLFLKNSKYYANIDKCGLI